jgi:hypothetical protein
MSGRAVTVLIERERLGVFGEHPDDEPPAFAQPATERLAIQEVKGVTTASSAAGRGDTQPLMSGW